MSNERSIIFSSEMVRAILEGRKTQTRRVLNPQPLDVITKRSNRDTRYIQTKQGVAKRCWFALYERNPNHGKMIYCRYGQPGDRLWVREAWQLRDETGYYTKADGKFHFHANCAAEYGRQDRFEHGWRPSIFMPHWASRITLEIKGVRVERLREITAKDAMAEGITGDTPIRGLTTYIHNLSVLWDSINEKCGYGWAENPWVWVIEFERGKP